MDEPIYLADLSWPAAAQHLAQDDRILMVTGATEQHGRHLPLGSDLRIPLLLAERLSARLGIPIAPPLPYGMSEAHMAFPGTMTLTEDTLRALYLELIQSLYRQGWRRLFVLNGHGGNQSAWHWVARLASKVRPDLRLYLADWWQEQELRDLVRDEIGRNEGHAGIEETALLLVAAPALVALEQAEGRADVDDELWTQEPTEIRRALPSGAIGVAPGEATVGLGERMLARLVESYAALLDGDWR